jgi:hypothetical protein
MWMFTKEKGEGRHQVYLGHAALMAGVQAKLQAVGKQSSLNILQNLLKWNKNYKYHCKKPVKVVRIWAVPVLF